MKFASVLIALVLSTSAAFASRSHKTVYHDYDGALRGIAIKNACLTEDEVQTIKPTRNCTELMPVTVLEGFEEITEYVCKTWEVAHVAHPRAFERTVCAQYGEDKTNLVCKRFAKKADFLPATIKTSVVTSNGLTDDFPGVTKRFTFPTCDSK